MPALGNRRSGRRGRPAGPFLLVLIAAVLLLAAACSSPGKPAPAGPSTTAASTGPAKTVVPPGTPAGAQLRWLIAAVARLPISGAQVRAHFDAAFLAQVSPAMLNQALQGATGVKLVSIQVSEPSMLVAIVSTSGALPRARVRLAVDSAGLISGLLISPAATGPVPGTWAGVDAALRPVAPRVRLLVANVSSGSCQPVHSMDPATAAPLGSAFKLYVLDALGNAVASGKVRWNQPLTVTAQLKSVPSGQLQNEPDGTRISVQDTAAYMISISDNTAADMLINLLGRPAVEAALTTTGMASPALDRPFLTTREMTILKLDQWPALADRYLAADEAAGGRCWPAPSTGLLFPARRRRKRGPRHGTSTAWNGSPRPMTSAAPTLPWPPSPVGPAWPRSARCSRSTTAAWTSTRPSGRQPGSRADPSQGS